MVKRNRGTYLFKNTAIFALGNLGTKLVSFFLVPLYTNLLSAQEYGVVDLVTAVGAALAPLLILNISEAVMRFALEEGADRNGVMSTGLALFLAAIGAGLLIVPGAGLFLDLGRYAGYLYFYTVSVAGSQLFLSFLRGKEQLAAYSVGNILQALAMAGWNLFFLLCRKEGAAGYLKACICANALTIVYAFRAGDVWDVVRHFRLDGALAKSMVKYSAVLIPNSFLWWIMNASDRLLITAMEGAAANGIYAVAYKIPAMLSTISGVFSQAWMYSAIREKETPDKDAYSNSVLKGLTAVLLTLAAGVMLMLKPFMRLYVDSAYYSAWEYVPYLVVGVVFSSLAMFLATSYTVHKDSRGFLLSTFCGAVMNLLLNGVLIPIWGCTGAAAATCISYAAVFVYRAADTKKYVRLRLASWPNIWGLALIVMDVLILEAETVWEPLLLFVVLLLELGLYSDVWLGLLRGIGKGRNHGGNRN